ncbi:MAG: hypothetical protein EOO23_04525 [Comamonadaceae bacterium]|nr:MAG: hypothetical protein EOO23_04525 [Comamonadaceae bacterium]
MFLITGFNNWGKTRMLFDLFGVGAFRRDRLYPFGGKQFMVVPKSNDDLGFKGYKDEVEKRVKELRDVGLRPKYIASAFCPTRETSNDSIQLLHDLYGSDQIEMLLLEHKWCLHAKLQLPVVERFYANEPNLTMHRVRQRQHRPKLAHVVSTVQALLP